ncbi:MAG: aminotransferase class I/II-fold pyridoxal phosphate-dependent enzyme [Candidatus Heimdallarchaeota archaeon]|nr:aminotransferase class I/II-fold pyridoxal phosphate-dependent enzyme [Candidatus Heimdallarchaeota archaeon]
MSRLPPYIFSEIERKISEKRREGLDLISLGIGDPDLPPPPFILESLKEEILENHNHKYSSSQGEEEFRIAVTTWYKNRFNVDLNPSSEAIALIGAKEGLANLARALINPGDKVLVPDPAYPVYANGATLLCDGNPIAFPLLEENEFLPDLDTLETSGEKMIYINYPNNPTGAVASKKFLREVVDFAFDNNLIICYDNSYSEICFDGYQAPSILEIKDAKEVAIEINSCSKAFNMTGDRIGFAVGNEQLITGLKKIKAQIDSGPAKYIQKAAIIALNSYSSNEPPVHLQNLLEIYYQRREVMYKRITELGFECKKPKATFYLWVDVHEDSMEFVTKLLNLGVIITPGFGFGLNGKTYVRFTFTQPKEVINKAFDRIAQQLSI